ncbi:hypothetical protein CVT26_007262 [Gymnopilus dilepis]|uniref:Methyltransferase domain-containing protein n=1 Tax=Gymnopilus dilepis TaxID=231916 RepID=A0A409VM64_9AGAR|nr:hypothetical protein CVT26_007262 [Gymnopilus dilepis]
MSGDGRTHPDIVKEDDPTTWELAWSQGITPWERGEYPQLSLREAIESSGLDLPRKGRALVPGCGAGYDVEYIGQTLGLECLGLDIADTAVQRANERFAKAKEANPDLSLSISKGDFFAMNPPEEELFDLVLDHTFFCAIPPSKRADWAKQMAKLIRPGGYLITIVYPLVPYFEPTGPPYWIKLEHYEELLNSNFVKVLDKVPEKSSPSHQGRERLVVWKKI